MHSFHCLQLSISTMTQRSGTSHSSTTLIKIDIDNGDTEPSLSTHILLLQSQICPSTWQFLPITTYKALRVNWMFFKSQLSRLMLTRRSRFLSGSVHRLPVFRNLHSFRIFSKGFKSNLLLFVNVRLMNLIAEYYQDLSQSRAFQGQILIDCIHHLHDDVLKFWNFNDPTALVIECLSISIFIIDAYFRSCLGSSFSSTLLALLSLLSKIRTMRHCAEYIGSII